MKRLTSASLFPFFFLLLFCASPTYPASAQGNALILDEGTGRYSLGPHLAYLEDKEGQWNIEDVTSEEMHRKFTPDKKRVLNFGFTNSVYWLRFTLETRIPVSEPGTSDSHAEWLLELAYPLLDYVTLYLPDGRGGFKAISTGDQFPFDHREVRHHHFIFPIQTKAGQRHTIYLFIKTDSSMQIPLTIWSPVRFAEKVSQEHYWLGIYYGIMLVMVIYNLFIFFSVRETNYLFYVLFIISYVFFQMSLSGQAYEYLWPDFPWWGNRSVPFSIGLAIFSMIQFSRHFLQTPRHSPLLDRGLLFFLAASGLMMMLALILNYSIAIRIVAAFVVFPSLALFAAGIVSLRKGYRMARYFLIAGLMIVVGIVLYSFKAFALLPSNFFTNYAIQTGSAMLVIVLAMGLADRINTERKDKLIAQEKALNAKQEALRAKEEAAEILEQTVEDRTGELRATLEHMENANNHILESIRYAEKIQRSLLPSKEIMDRCFHQYFVIQEPKYIVGGDIYLFEKFEEGYLVVLADCTGHGVPGSLMTMLAGAAFRTIVKEPYYNDPAQVLDALDKMVRTSLCSEEREGISDDGMDAGVCFVNTKRNVLTFAGAKIPLIYVAENHLYVIKGDRQSIGYQNADTEFEFANHCIPIQPGMVFYMASDGITDQIGGSKAFPFGYKRFQSLLKDIWGKPFDEQKERIMKTYMEWKSDEEPRDDVTVLGFGF